MSVARIREIVKRMRALGVKVHEEPGCWSRGNGMSPAYQGIVNHHTATGFANSNLGILIHGRPDLSGPLCNFCTWSNGDLGLIAAFPANHAGASGGWDTAPLPRTSVFNKYVIGNEIIYPGTQPMTDAQMRTALLLSKVAVAVVGGGAASRAKFHQGTSITGKWDPGFAEGKTYNISKFRRDMRNVSAREEDLSYLHWPAKDRRALIEDVVSATWERNVRNWHMSQVKGKKVPEPAWVALGTIEMRFRAIMAGERKAIIAAIREQRDLSEDEVKKFVDTEVAKVEDQIAGASAQEGQPTS